MPTAKTARIWIIGAGGHGSELRAYMAQMAAQGKRVELCGFVDENESSASFAGTKVFGKFQQLKDFLKAHPRNAFYYITAVGDNRVRSELVRRVESLRARNLLPWTLRHPSVPIGSEVEVGEGTCLAPGSVVTTRVKIGRHCILNVNASVSHDCRIGDFVNLNPGAVICGNVRIGQGCYIGAGATIIDKVSVGDWTVVGAGAVVVEDIPPHVTAVGVPARVIKRHAR